MTTENCQKNSHCRLSPLVRGERLWLWGLLLCLLGAASMSARTLEAVDYGMRAGEDATPALRRALEACRAEGADVLQLPPGRYELHPEQAFEQYRAISNHDNGRKAIGLPLVDFTGLTVRGQQTELICHGQMVPLVIDRCRDLTIEGITIDWAVPFHIQGKVVAVDPEHRSYELALLDDGGYTVEAGALYHGERTGDERTSWRRNLEWGAWFDGETGAMIPASTAPDGALNYHRWDALTDAPSRVEALGGNRVCLTRVSERLPEVGWVYVAKGRAGRTPATGLNRLSPAVHITGSTDVTLRDMTIHHAGGMGVIAERSRDLSLQRLQVVPRPGSGRMISTTADATHFVGCGGEIRLEDCTFANMMDDGVNVHGVYVPVLERLADNRLGVRVNHFQQAGHVFAGAGDHLQFSRAATLQAEASRLVERVEWINESYAILHFSEALPSEIGPGWIVDNLDWQADLVMRRCTVRNNRARSVLVTTAGRVRIEDCRFLNPSLMCILMEGDSHYWFESGAVQDVLIRGNRFRMIHPTLPVFRIAPIASAVLATDAPYHRNIRVVDNVIETPSGNLVEGRRVGDLCFLDNQIAYTGEGEPPPASGFTFERSSGIEVQGLGSSDWAVFPLRQDGTETAVEVQP